MSEFNIEEYINSLPDDTETITVKNKSLTYIPSLKRFHKLKKLHCDNNQLTSLPELNDSLQILYCWSNKLTHLPKLNNSLQELHCSNNQLTRLPELNDSLKELYCYNNQLTILPKLNDSLKQLDCSHNPLTSFMLEHSGYLNNERKNKLNNKIQCLYRFKMLFWSLTFKTKFRDWLWMKVRLPKIEQRYHPSELNKLLNDMDDITEEELDNVLINW